MPSQSITITVADLGAFGSRLAQEIAKAGYLPAMKKIVVAAKADFKERFETATAPDGAAWPPLVGWRARSGGKGHAFKPLQDRGLLRASAAAQGTGHIEDVTAFSMEVGTNLDYAHVHQDGMTIRPVNGKALAIPFTPEAYRAGNARNFPRPLRLVWPKGARKGYLVEDKAGRGKNRRGEKSIIQYILITHAVIPKREFIGWSPALVETAERIIGEYAAKVAEGDIQP